MSTQYNGVPSNITVPSGVAIFSSTSGTPAAVATGVAHGLTTGDEVVIVGHQTNYALNVRATVTVTGTNTFTMNGVSGIATGGSTGTVYPLSLGATFPQPSDGDAADGASIDVPLEAVGDRTAFLAANIGRYKPISLVYTTADDDATESTVWITHNFASTSTWEQCGNLPGSISGSLQANDVLDIDFTGTASWNANMATFISLVSIWVGFSPSGGSIGSWTKLAGSGQRLPTSPSGGGVAGVNLRGQINVPSGAQNVALALYAWCNNATSCQLTMMGDRRSLITIWRPTDFVNRLG